MCTVATPFSGPKHPNTMGCPPCRKTLSWKIVVCGIKEHKTPPTQGGVIALWMATHFSNEVHRFVIVNSAAGPLPDTAVPEPPHTTPSLDLGRVTQLDPTAIFPDTPAGNAALCRYIRLVEVRLRVRRRGGPSVGHAAMSGRDSGQGVNSPAINSRL